MIFRPIVLGLTRCCLPFLGILFASSYTAAAHASAAPTAPNARERVVLLHGLGRRAPSMQKMADALTEAGYEVCNVAYPSLAHPIPELAADHVLPAIKQCFALDRQLHFVAHSLGGILVRELAAKQPTLPIGRVVMLSPPNSGSQLADKLNSWRVFELSRIPAGTELGTAGDYSPASLGAATFDVGILTGDRTVNPILSTLIDGPDDGKVGVEEARLEGMRAFRVIHATHTFIMSNREAIELTLRYLRSGAFEAQSADARRGASPVDSRDLPIPERLQCSIRF